MILAIDQGTSSTRAVLINDSGEIIKTSQREINVYTANGYVEQNPTEIMESVYSVINDVVKGEDVSQIKGMGITNQRETTILWQKSTGKPVYNAIVWQCRRTEAYCEKLRHQGLEKEIQDVTGLIIDPYFSATKIRWILDNVDGAADLAEENDLLFGTVESYIVWNLTEGKYHITDYTNASRTMLFDIHNLCWSDRICEMLNIPTTILPAPVENIGDFGTVTNSQVNSISGLPICSMIGDQQSALIGQGCIRKGMAKNTYGTGCFMLVNTGEEIKKSRNKLLSTVALGVNGKVTYCIEGSSFNCGTVVDLAVSLGFADGPKEIDKLAESVPNSNGVFFIPALTGLGAPYWSSSAKGRISGITRDTVKGNICRAVLEGIAMGVKDLAETYTLDTGEKITNLRVDGGVSNSDFVLNLQSDLLDCTVDKPECVESTVMGAGFLAGLKAGIFKDITDIEKIRKSRKTFEPTTDKNEKERVAKLYDDYKKEVENLIN